MQSESTASLRLHFLWASSRVTSPTPPGVCRGPIPPRGKKKIEWIRCASEYLHAATFPRNSGRPWCFTGGFGANEPRKGRAAIPIKDHHACPNRLGRCALCVGEGLAHLLEESRGFGAASRAALG